MHDGGGGMTVGMENGTLRSDLNHMQEAERVNWVCVGGGCQHLNSPPVMSFFLEGPTSQNSITSPNSATHQGPSEQIHESVGDNSQSNHQTPHLLATLSFFFCLFPFPNPFCSLPSFSISDFVLSLLSWHCLPTIL